MKSKPNTCLFCGGRLFMEGKNGEKICAKCGRPVPGTGEVKPKEHNKPSFAKTTICPTCGSMAEMVSNTSDGKELYACSVCGNRFTPIVKEARPMSEPEPLPSQNGKPEPKKNGVLSGREIFEIAEANTVEILAHEGDPLYGASGSGFFFAENGYILTNAHVILSEIEKPTPAAQILVRFKNSEYTKAIIVDFDEAEDMAVLQTTLPCSNIAKIAKESPETGEAIYAVGNSAGQGMCILEGIVADKEREVIGKDFMMISANIVGGNSGGPIFNTKGEVVGIVTLGSTEAVAMNFGIPIKRIEKFLKYVENRGLGYIHFKRK